MKACVLFHSVCGNTYLLARQYADTLTALGIDVSLYRLYDPQYDQLAPLFEASRTYQDALRNVPVLEQSSLILDADMIFLGSPTYFGNVSTAVKAFMDSCCDFWVDARLAGKKFGCFACASTYQGGGDICLQAMNTFAQHMGMVPISVPCNIKGAVQPAYGIKHVSGEMADRAVTKETKMAVQNYVDHILKVIS